MILVIGGANQGNWPMSWKKTGAFPRRMCPHPETAEHSPF